MRGSLRQSSRAATLIVLESVIISISDWRSSWDIKAPALPIRRHRVARRVNTSAHCSIHPAPRQHGPVGGGRGRIALRIDAQSVEQGSQVVAICAPAPN